MLVSYRHHAEFVHKEFLVFLIFPLALHRHLAYIQIISKGDTEMPEFVYCPKRDMILRVLEAKRGIQDERRYLVCKATADWTTGHGIFSVRQDEVEAVN